MDHLSPKPGRVVENVEVKPDQVWQDNDPRVTYKRELKVVRIEGEHAFCEVGRGGKLVRIKVKRFRPTASGYRFVCGPR